MAIQLVSRGRQLDPARFGEPAYALGQAVLLAADHDQPALATENVRTIAAQSMFVAVSSVGEEVAILLRHPDVAKLFRFAGPDDYRTKVIRVEQHDPLGRCGQRHFQNAVRGQLGQLAEFEAFLPGAEFLGPGTELLASPQPYGVGNHHATIDQHAAHDGVPGGVDLLGMQEDLRDGIHPFGPFPLLSVVQRDVNRLARSPAEGLERIQRRLPKYLWRVPLRLGDEMGDRLPRPTVFAQSFDPVQAAPPIHPGQRQHDPPKVGKVTRADQFAGATKEALAKRWKSAYLWHWIFPPWPGPGTCRVGTYNYGRKDPFSLQYQPVSAC
jgi:hypothetical protein